MSTLPRDSTDATNGNVVMMAPAGTDVEEAVRTFQSAAASLAIAPLDAGVLKGLCQQVAVFTSELFPGEVRIMVKNDPDIPQDLYFVFRVRSKAGVDELAALNDQWHRRLLMLKGRRSGLFRLAIDFH